MLVSVDMTFGESNAGAALSAEKLRTAICMLHGWDHLTMMRIGSSSTQIVPLGCILCNGPCLLVICVRALLRQSACSQSLQPLSVHLLRRERVRLVPTGSIVGRTGSVFINVAVSLFVTRFGLRFHYKSVKLITLTSIEAVKLQQRRKMFRRIFSAALKLPIFPPMHSWYSANV